MTISRSHTLRAFASILACTVLIWMPRADAQKQATTSLNLPDLYSADVLPGDTSVTIPFEVSGADSITLDLIVPVDGAAFSLSDPAMAVALTSADPSVDFVAGSTFSTMPVLPGGMFHTEAIFSPADGTWTLTVTFPAAAEATVVMATVFVETNYQAGIVVPGNRFVVGQEVSLGLLALDGGVPIAGLAPELSVTLTNPPGVPAMFMGADNGVGADGLASDGIYSAEVTFMQAGTYRIDSTVLIPDGLGTVTRWASPVLIDIVDPPMLPPTIAVSTLNPTGCVDGIQVDLDWDTLVSGEAVARCFLRASNGNEITAGMTIDNIVAPSHEVVSVIFPTEDIKEGLAVNGPYTLSRVEIFLVKNDEITVGFRGRDLATTDPIILTDLCRAENIEVGNPDDSSMGVALDVETVVTSGFISSVNLNFPVFVTLAGTYTFSFKILGEANAEATVARESVFLTVGANDIMFEVGSAGFLGVDGPYSVVSILVTGPSGAAALGELGAPFAGIRWQFAPNINGDLDNDDDVDSDDKTLLLESRNTAALDPGDRRDLNGDGNIDILDARTVVNLRCAGGACATNAPTSRVNSIQYTDRELLSRGQE